MAARPSMLNKTALFTLKYDNSYICLYIFPIACKVTDPSFQRIITVYYTQAFTASQSSKTHLRVIKYLVQRTEYQRHFTADPDQVVMKCRAITKKSQRAFRGSTTILHKSAAVDRPERDLQALWAAAKPENDPEHPESFAFKTLHGRGRSFPSPAVSWFLM